MQVDQTGHETGRPDRSTSQVDLWQRSLFITQSCCGIKPIFHGAFLMRKLHNPNLQQIFTQKHTVDKIGFSHTWYDSGTADSLRFQTRFSRLKNSVDNPD